jgi:hypothetical protein
MRAMCLVRGDARPPARRRRIDGDARVELDAELVLDRGGWDEPTSVQPHCAKRPHA